MQQVKLSIIPTDNYYAFRHDIIIYIQYLFWSLNNNYYDNTCKCLPTCMILGALYPMRTGRPFCVFCPSYLNHSIRICVAL